MSQQVSNKTRYEAGKARQASLGSRWRAIKAHKYMILEVSKVALLAQYKKSFLGILWLILYPLFSIVIWLFLHKMGTLNPGETRIPYALFLFLSMILFWQFFIGFYHSTKSTIVENQNLLVQNNFPPEVLVFQRVIVQMVNFLIPLVLAIVIFIIYDVDLTWQGIVLYPLLVIPLFLIAISIGMFASLLNVVSLDIFNIFDRIMQLLIFVSPIIYSDKTQSELLQAVLQYNPLTYLIAVPRDLLIDGVWNGGTTYFVIVGCSVVLFILSFRFYSRSVPKMVERLAIS